MFRKIIHNNDEREDIIDRLDGEIPDYPDRNMVDFYISYISKYENSDQLLPNLN